MGFFFGIKFEEIKTNLQVLKNKIEFLMWKSVNNLILYEISI